MNLASKPLTMTTYQMTSVLDVRPCKSAAPAYLLLDIYSLPFLQPEN
jgi:hypothetical protein